MFERFTADARAVVVSAQAVARESGARAIDGRHLLLGLTEAAGPATEAMTSVGLDPVRLALDLRTELSSGRAGRRGPGVGRHRPGGGACERR